MNNANLIFATMPIGNIDDASFNLINCLKKTEVLVVENDHIIDNIKKNYDIQLNIPIISLKSATFLNNGKFDSNINHRKRLYRLTDLVIFYLKQNKLVTCISDEGSPLIVDPFMYIRDVAIVKNIKYKVLSGPSAIISSISNSKLYNGECFAFYGFIYYSNIKKELYKKIKENKYVSVIFCTEAIKKDTIDELIFYLGSDRNATILSNLTGENEFVFDGNLKEIREFLVKNNLELFTLVISGTILHKPEKAYPIEGFYNKEYYPFHK